MYPFFVALHVVICMFLILVIMLQPGKSGDPGLAFGGGGGSSNLFGPRGPTGLLQRVTSVFAAAYLVTTITLALYSNRAMLANANVEEELQRLEQEENAQQPAPDDAVPPTDPSMQPAPELVPDLGAPTVRPPEP